jgi:glycosyltransferase involved in cell wall biosynthesis
MKLTAILTSFNEGNDLMAALNRLADQTRMPDEIIVVEDGSTDRESHQVANLYESETMRFVPGFRVWPTKFFRLPSNVGVSYAMAKGLGEATGDCVWFGAVGDRLAPTFFERSMALHEKGSRLTAARGRLGAFTLGKIRDGAPWAMRLCGALICSHVAVARTIDMHGFFDASERWHCDFGAHHAIAHWHGVAPIHEVMTEIGTRPGYSAKGERSADHEGVLRLIARRFYQAPAVLGNLGWPMARFLWRERQLDAFTPAFLRRCAWRMAGKALRKVWPC